MGSGELSCSPCACDTASTGTGQRSTRLESRHRRGGARPRPADGLRHSRTRLGAGLRTASSVSALHGLRLEIIRVVDRSETGDPRKHERRSAGPSSNGSEAVLPATPVAPLPLRQSRRQLLSGSREVFLERPSIRTSKLQDDPAVELHLLQIAPARPNRGARLRRQMIVESPLMIVRMDVRESRAGDLKKPTPLMSEGGVAGIETDRYR